MSYRFIPTFLLLFTSQTYGQDVRNEHWGMSQAEVIKAESSKPLKRSPGSLVYHDIESGIPAQVLFEFTEGKLDQLSYVADVPDKAAENSFLKWCLDMTKQYGKGVVYFNKKPVGSPGKVLDGVLAQFWQDKAGEVVVVYPQTTTTTVGVALSMLDGKPVVDMDYAKTP